MPEYNNVWIKRPLSTYTVQLRGVTGKNTAGITIQGVYNASFAAFGFAIETSGVYQLWEDPLGGSSYARNAEWDYSDTEPANSGKIVLGGDYVDTFAF